MSAITAELESELAQELAAGTEAAAPRSFGAGQGEAEQESFFNHLSAMADRSGRSQALRRVALAAARQALRANPAPAPIVEGEAELSHELLLEVDAIGGPGALRETVAAMEHLAHEASSAESEQEAAEQFLPLIPLAARAVAPLAARILPRLGRRVLPAIIRRVAPALTRGVAQVTRTLFRSPMARPLIRAVPTIARRTVARLARQYAHGRPITGRTALRTLAAQTARVLGAPRPAVHAFRRSRYWDRRYHAAAGRLVGGVAAAPVSTRPAAAAPPPGFAPPTFAPSVGPAATAVTPHPALGATLPVPVVALVPYPWSAAVPAR